MNRNWIVVRNSPDWLNFNLESSRGMMKRINLPETLIIDYAAIWDRVLPVSFREFRHELKQMSFRNFHTVENAVILSIANILDFAELDRIVFTDDDDWFDPLLFRHEANEAGLKWKSIRLGLGFSRAETEVLTFRNDEQTIFTNNYLITGRSLHANGLDSLLEHYNASATFEAGKYKPLRSSVYLSCANKSLASVVAAMHLMTKDDFVGRPELTFEAYRQAIANVQVPFEYPWLKSILTEYQALVSTTFKV
jgi:hypothetical protein